MTQKSREAIIQLLFIALYRDHELSLAEDTVLNEALDSLGWESQASWASFLFTAFTTARAATADPVKEESLFRSLSATVRDEQGSAEALTWLTRVLAADGLSNSEKRFLERLEKVFFS